jgi:hypothetical protein
MAYLGGWNTGLEYRKDDNFSLLKKMEVIRNSARGQFGKNNSPAKKGAPLEMTGGDSFMGERKDSVNNTLYHFNDTMEYPTSMNPHSTKHRKTRMDLSNKTAENPPRQLASQRFLNARTRLWQAHDAKPTLGPIYRPARDLQTDRSGESPGIQNVDGKTYISPKTIMRHTRNRLHQMHAENIQYQDMRFLFKKDPTRESETDDPV